MFMNRVLRSLHLNNMNILKYRVYCSLTINNVNIFFKKFVCTVV